MPRLKRFLRWCFGFLALQFFLVSTSTVSALLRSSHVHGFVPTTRGMIAAVLAKGMFVLPLPLGVLYAMSWWTVKRGKASARGWAIAASLGLLLLSIPLLFATFYGPRKILFLDFLDAAVLFLGIAGLVAFIPRDALAQGKAQIATPRRIAGDGTSSLVDAVAWLLQIAGYFAGMRWCERWGHAHGLRSAHQSLLWTMVALLIACVVHEFGHAATGRALGMRLRAFIAGPFQWQISDGKWRFRFLPAQIFSAGGATAVVPTDPEQSRWSQVCMIAAGPVANLCTGLISWWVALTAKGRSYEQIWGIFATFATLSLVLFAANLIPFRSEAAYSDGALIFQLLSGGPWADLHRALSIVSSTLVTRLRPRDYDIQAIQRAARYFLHGRQAMLLHLFAAAHFLDCGSIPEACEALARAESIYLESASDISAELHTEFVFGNAYLRRDAVSAREWWVRMEAKKPKHFGVDYWLARSALLWVENNQKEAREAWKKGDALAQQLPAAGAYEFDRDRYKLLRRVLDMSAASAC